MVPIDLIRDLPTEVAENGDIPATVVYTLFADAIVAGSLSASREAFTKLLIAGGLLVVLTFVPTAVRRVGRATVER
jgi:hypothetical protein